MNKKLLTAETLAMEKSEKIRALEKKLAAGVQTTSPAPAPAEKDGPTTAEFNAMREINQKMNIGMKEMQQALMDTRREKNEIISKSEKEFISTCMPHVVCIRYIFIGFLFFYVLRLIASIPMK